MAGGAILGVGLSVDRNDDWINNHQVELTVTPKKTRETANGLWVLDLPLDSAVHLMQLIGSVLRSHNAPIYDINGVLIWMPPSEEATV
ncbi:hypothetical protein LCGC14_0295470 [marine sediment metagenome]|uniref:Uncharacterized protein n=1 Tax=marine sediment metagenome TaxID=412755 RepID=A0A0F9TX78_9ZZZZ